MKVLKAIALVLVGLVILFVVVGLLLPSTYRVERATTIEAPASQVFAQVNDFRNWEPWSPWAAKDPTIESTYRGAMTGEGAVASWTSEHSGNGTQTIVRSIPNERIVTRLDFGEMGTATSYWDFATRGVTSTHVVWGLHGRSDGLVGRYLSLMIDRMVGREYEDGLRRLQRHVEAMPATAPAATTTAAALTGATTSATTTPVTGTAR